jgi:hypothetical protein
MDRKTITPIIKKTRTLTQDYEVCPHCMREIGEKSVYVDGDNLVYHRPCMASGPIDKIVPAKLVWDDRGFFRAASCKSSAKPVMKWTGTRFAMIPEMSPRTREIEGVFRSQMGDGVDYDFYYTAHVGDGDRTSNDSVSVDRPEGMPDHIWSGSAEGLKTEALRQARAKRDAGGQTT